ncbi:hypothetical protein [Undibacterium sp.]|jgi:hypothetical protein|uniref:hypothetical protein n=1 Tax=Undibacterium sp. TaxID=1914977 RepID=UPI002C567C25|nr:hypothetical protein [Undibacterium sp.]HTD06999.1 hypothetical protein [Undibacterium sp.]
MAIEQEIEAIRAGIKAGRFPNEASVSQGIVLRLLNALGWPAYDTDAVWPEYALGGRRVDFALCSPPSKPIAFIEVKQIGQSDGAERQLFEYAFHIGVPMAILTDGREWNFFLPGEQGDYGERRVYKLDIVDRDATECAERLERYLLHSAVASGSAIQAARDDYRNVSKDRQMLAAFPKAWSQLIAEDDDMLLEIVADRVESLCGFKPGPDMVAAFLKGSILNRLPPAVPPRGVVASATRPVATAVVEAKPANSLPVMPKAALIQRSTALPSGQTGFTFAGVFHPTRNAIDTLRQIFDLFVQNDQSFAERFAGLPRHGRTRRYLARDANDLYRDRPDLVRECSVKLDSGWWISTNHSKQTISQIIAMACDVAQVAYGKDLIINLD